MDGEPILQGNSFGKFFIERLRLLTHVVGSPSHEGITRRALPASGGKDEVGEYESK